MTAKENCLNDLKDRILRLDLAPGMELEESKLTQAYGLSRTPLREVFRDLAGAGYLRLQHNRGARVAALDFATLRVFFRSAPLVFGSIARMAAEYRDATQLDMLRQEQEAYCAADGEAEVALANHRFHMIVGEMAQNPYLQPALDRLLLDHTRLSLGTARPSPKKERKAQKKSIQQHEDLITAIEARDPDAAVAAVQAHWELARSRFDTLMDADPLPEA